MCINYICVCIYERVYTHRVRKNMNKANVVKGLTFERLL